MTLLQGKWSFRFRDWVPRFVTAQRISLGECNSPDPGPAVFNRAENN